MVRPDKSRYVWLYLPSRADKERWQALADKAKTPLSTWAISIIEDRLVEEDGGRPRQKLLKDLEALKAKIKALRDELRQKAIVIERYKADLRKYRAQAFLAEDFQGVRQYSRELVDLLRTRGYLDSYEILQALGIDPMESDQVKSISTQLEELERYGLVKADGRGWQWMA
ncbi:MAG: hypothetical protein QUS08_01685 [Methanothrix sp.]|nr:hypothetical protein [Methanothrix sp.]